MVKCDYILILYLCSNHSQQHVQQCHVTRPTAQKQFQFQLLSTFFLNCVHYFVLLDYDYNEMASLATSSESKTPTSIFNQEESEAILQLRAILTPDYKDDEWFSTYLDDTTL